MARAQEDFSSLTLKSSDLRPETPLLGEELKTPEFIRTLVRVQWRPSDPVDLYIIRPANVKNPPVVLYLYGYPTDTARFRDNTFCKHLVHSGVAAVGFVSAFTGPRADHHPLSQTFIKNLPEALAVTVHDVQMILNYLETRHDLDMSRVGMFGVGSGGAIAILAAEADPRIKALDLLEPWGDWPGWISHSAVVPDAERPKLLTPEALMQLQKLEPALYLPGLKSRHMRIQFRLDDDKEPHEVISQFEFATPATAKIVHYRTMGELSSTMDGGRIFEWIAGELKPPATLTAAAKPTAEANPANR